MAMKINYDQANFLTSATRGNQFVEDFGAEVAFAGRSNSGKSSALNTLCRQKALARISKTPGRTQMINFFQIDSQHRLVDLPGYGYAKVPESTRLRWRNLMKRYFEHRESLRGILLIMDIRHPLTPYDWQMIEWCQYYNYRIHILLNKADKLKRGPALNTLQRIENIIKDKNISIQTFSATKRKGLEEAYSVLDLWLIEH